MSRVKEEFKRRTAIFEGAYRAWSHLGGLDLEVLIGKRAKDLDPTTFPLVNDSRKSSGQSKSTNCYPYEPLPRSGLAHPFVQAILAPWLGPHADHEAVKMGLETLRTWWLHRRNGENKTAIKELGTADMRVIVDKYTIHFFNLAHCLVVSDNEQPPRTLQTKMKQSEKWRVNLTDPGIADAEKMPAPRMLGGVSSTDLNTGPLINVKGKCIPGKIDFPGMVGAVNRYSGQPAHRDSLGTANDGAGGNSAESVHGDPKTTPVVYRTSSGDYLLAMEVDGITCAHCVKIVETVLKGCLGGKSPISGLVDAAADHGISCVVVKMESAHEAKRIAFESARNLSLVGYTAKPKEVALSGDGNVDLESLQKAVVRFASANTFDFFDFALQCSCPHNGVFRDKCPRHSQMNEALFTGFAVYQRRLVEYVNSKSWTDSKSIIELEPRNQDSKVRAAVTTRGNPLLVVDETMDFQELDFPEDANNEAEGADMEPIPLEKVRLRFEASFHQGGYGLQHHAAAAAPPHPPHNLYHYNNSSGGIISALAIDWDYRHHLQQPLPPIMDNFAHLSSQEQRGNVDDPEYRGQQQQQGFSYPSARPGDASYPRRK